MIPFILGAGLAFSALVASALLIRTESWWEVHPTLWSATLTLGLVPLFSAWAAAEVMRIVRSPKVLSEGSGMSRRLLAGLTAGLVSSATGALAVVTLEPNGGGRAWLLMGASAFASTIAVLAFAKRRKRGHCRRCDYDLAGVTPAARGRCPECGLDQMAAT
ncbi:MAG TPA: hypothetical protein VEB22_11895 [Phycisphaerales bacterium]|nr:hypothetical protein [Phycisphaerales bacterium]